MTDHTEKKEGEINEKRMAVPPIDLRFRSIVPVNPTPVHCNSPWRNANESYGDSVSWQLDPTTDSLSSADLTLTHDYHASEISEDMYIATCPKCKIVIWQPRGEDQPHHSSERNMIPEAWFIVTTDKYTKEPLYIRTSAIVSVLDSPLLPGCRIMCKGMTDSVGVQEDALTIMRKIAQAMREHGNAKTNT